MSSDDGDTSDPPLSPVSPLREDTTDGQLPPPPPDTPPLPPPESSVESVSKSAKKRRGRKSKKSQDETKTPKKSKDDKYDKDEQQQQHRVSVVKYITPSESVGGGRRTGRHSGDRGSTKASRASRRKRSSEAKKSHRRKSQPAWMPPHDCNRVPLLDTLGIDRPLKSSHLSADQITMLHGLWREFMMARMSKQNAGADAMNHVRKLFEQASTYQQKYEALGLTLGHSKIPEERWIVDPSGASQDARLSPFVDFLRKRPSVMSNLRMAFRPVMNHSERHLEALDISAYLSRVRYWLQGDTRRNFSVAGIMEGPPAEEMQVVRRLINEWTKFRYHVVMMNSNTVWLAVLFDRKRRVMEIYQPGGSTLDIDDETSYVSRHVRYLIKAVKDLDADMKPVINSRIRRGIRAKHDQVRSVMVMYYLYARIVRGASFEDIVAYLDKHASGAGADAGADCFFIMAHPEEKSGAEEQSFHFSKGAFAAYDIRLAGLDLVAFMHQTVASLGLSQIGQRDIQEWMSQLTGPNSHEMLEMVGYQYQSRLLQAMPREYQVYAGTRIWYSIMREIFEDPLSELLRKERGVSHKGGASSLVRHQHAARIMEKLVNWIQKDTIDPQIKDRFIAMLRQMIQTMYLPVLRFDPDNHSRFADPNMSVLVFLKECMKRKSTVSFGVHILRLINSWVQAHVPNMDYNLDEIHPHPFKAYRPHLLGNMGQVKQVVNACDAVMKRARQMLQESQRVNTVVTQNTREAATAPPHPQQQQYQSVLPNGVNPGIPQYPSLLGGIQPGAPVVSQPPFATSHVPQVPQAQQVQNAAQQAAEAATMHTKSVVHRMLIMQRAEFQQKTFLKDGVVQPWNFPLSKRFWSEEFGKHMPVPVNYQGDDYVFQHTQAEEAVHNQEFVMHYVIAHYRLAKGVANANKHVSKEALAAAAVSLVYFERFCREKNMTLMMMLMLHLGNHLKTNVDKTHSDVADWYRSDQGKWLFNALEILETKYDDAKPEKNQEFVAFLHNLEQGSVALNQRYVQQAQTGANSGGWGGGFYA